MGQIEAEIQPTVISPTDVSALVLRPRVEASSPSSYKDAQVAGGSSGEIPRVSIVFIFFFITVRQMLQEREHMVALEEDTGRALCQVSESQRRPFGGHI